MNESRWHVLYTRSQFEKKVHSMLQEQQIESFLPTYKTLRQWKDRKKWIEVPLYRSYCFVKVTPKTYPLPLTIKGVVRYVWFDGKPAIIDEQEIDLLKKISNNSTSVEIVETAIEKGQKIRVIAGPFANHEGEVIEIKGKHRVVFRIHQLPYSPAIEIPKNYLQVL